MRREGLDITVVQDHKALEIFLRLPWKLYEGHSHWVPPLLKTQRELFSGRNPFLQHAEMRLFLATINGESVGRVAGIIDREFLQIYQERVGFFGFFESVPDYDVAKELLVAAECFLKEEGMEKIRGPVNPSMHDEIGFLTEGYDLSPSIMMPYNPRWYGDFIEQYGFRKAKDFLAFTVDLTRSLDPVHVDVIGRVKKSGITLRPMNVKNFWEEIQLLRNLYNTTFMETHRHWSFVPMTREEARIKGEFFRPFLSADLIWFAEARGRPIGFSLNLPDISPVLKKVNGRLDVLALLRFFFARRSVNNVRSVANGVLKEHAGMGIGTALLLTAIARMQGKGYSKMEWSWVIEDNIASIRLITKVGGRKYKEYRIYEKDL